MKMAPLLVPAAALCACAAFAPPVVATMTPRDQTAGVVRASLDGHAYQTGGYGRGEVDAMRRDQGPYDLRLTFSEGRHDAFLADLKLRIEDAGGHQVFAYRDAGPLTDVELPAGRYRVIADYKGQQRSGEVRIQAGKPAYLYLHWPHEA